MVHQFVYIRGLELADELRMDLAFPLQLLSVVMAAILLHDVLEVHCLRTGRVLTPAGTVHIMDSQTRRNLVS